MSEEDTDNGALKQLHEATQKFEEIGQVLDELEKVFRNAYRYQKSYNPDPGYVLGRIKHARSKL